MSHFWKELFRLQGTSLNEYNLSPESEGQTKALNRILENYLRRFIPKQPVLSRFYSVWNTSIILSLKALCNFEVVYERSPPSLTKFVPRQTLVEALSHKFNG